MLSPKKAAPSENAIKPADQPTFGIDLDRMCVACIIKCAVEFADARIDPGLIAIASRSGTARDDAIEIEICPHLETVGSNGSGKPTRNVEIVDWQDAASLRLDPVDRRVLGILRHGEDAGGIGFQQDLRSDVHAIAVVVVVHGY